MAMRDTLTDEADVIREFGDRLRRIENLAFLSGTVSVGALRIGGFLVEVDPVNGDLQARRLSDNATATILAA